MDENIGDIFIFYADLAGNLKGHILFIQNQMI
jgi:hypothetical protein